MLNTVEAILNQDGKLEFQEKVEWKNSVRVLVTFIDSNLQIQNKKNQFQFLKARDILKKYNLNLADTIIEERRMST
ncbi:MAG: hypothetical protein H7A23_18070 [Leptospiraceae bacterium]|nr:hypothetical protein [Leptospiraceae bacterium]MCP5496456.1 hypothetical protein [Leptospiraceae bacterium]